MRSGLLNHHTTRAIWNANSLRDRKVAVTLTDQTQLLQSATVDLITSEVNSLTIFGLNLFNPVSNPETHLSVSSGRTVTTIGGKWAVSLVTTLTKRLDELWVEGNNQGGRFTGATLGNTTYHCFLLYEPATQKVDVGFDLLPTATNRPSGWVARRIGAIRRVAGAIEPFTQYSTYFEKKTSTVDVNVDVPNSGATYLIGVPSGIPVMAHGVLAPGLSDINVHLAISAYNPAKTSPTIASSSGVVAGFNASTGSNYYFNDPDESISGSSTNIWVPTDSTARISLKSAGSNFPDAIWNSTFQTLGWDDFNLIRGL